MDIFKANNYEEIGGNSEFEIEVAEGIDAQGEKVEIKEEPTVEEPTVEEAVVEEPAVDEPAVEEPTVDEPEVGQLHAAILLEPQQDGTMEMTPVGATMNKAPENINKEFEVIKDNVIDKENLAAQLYKVTSLEIDDVMQSVEQLKGALDKLGIPYDKTKNLVVEDRDGGITAFCLTDQKENEQVQSVDMEQEGESQNIPDMEEDKEIDDRIRDVGSIDSGELYAIINAEDKDKFNKIIDNIKDSRESADMAKEQIQQVEKREAKEAREQGGFEMTR